MENVRNFVIISHIDHGKSTLADRFLELTKTVEAKKMRAQYLDMMDLERERGITIKMQPVRMFYRNSSGSEYLFNLIDTPGHVDFTYEVSRSLKAVEGALLLVDASKGIQAQTIGNLELAQQQGLVIIPVINKIDLPQAKTKETEKEISDLLNLEPSEIIKISAKEGTNVSSVLESVVKRIPPPDFEKDAPLQALIFDSKYDSFKGVLAFLRVLKGNVKKGQKLYLVQKDLEFEAKETGVFVPSLLPVESLSSGDIGYIATGIKDSERIRVGETVISKDSKPEKEKLALSGYKEPQPKVFLSVYPENADDFEDLKTGLEKLKLTDASLYFKPEFKEGLGRGFQCGFLGLLHAEIIAERLKREFNLSLVMSTPSVLYKIFMGEKENLIYTSADWPSQSLIASCKELWVKLQILTPLSYMGPVLELLDALESKQVSTDYMGSEKIQLVWEVPLREIVTKSLYDQLKGVSKGFASMDYEILEWREVSLVKLDILILGKKEEAFSRIVPEKEAQKEGRKLVEKLKEKLPPQVFSLPLQAAVGGKVIARETIRAKRKDVTAPLYGGDYTRKKKLLDKQKKRKKELKEKGRIQIPPRIFLEIFKSD